MIEVEVVVVKDVFVEDFDVDLVVVVRDQDGPVRNWTTNC